MAISDKITRLQNAKTAIATAITNKGGTVASGDGYEDFANDIATIPSGGIYQEKTVTINGTVLPDSGYDALSKVTVNVQTSWPPSTITAGDTPVKQSSDVCTWESAHQSSLAYSGISLTIPKSGTYRFKWISACDVSGYTMQSRLYKNSVAVGTIHDFTATNENHNYTNIEKEDITCSAGDTIQLYFKLAKKSLSYYGTVSMLTACINGDNGF